jgi:small-conductance mechanosensitive channel
MADILLMIRSGLGGNTWDDLGDAALVFAAVLLGFWGFRVLVLSRLRALVKRTRTTADDELVAALGAIGMPAGVVVALFVGLQTLVVPPFVVKVAWAILLVVLTVEGVKIAQHVMAFLLRRSIVRFGRSDDESVVALLQMLVRIVLWTVAILLILSNLGLEVTSLVASLGIGGVAIALAVQNILGDVFNSFSIYLDRPFEVGDFIVIGEHKGTVKRIGLKTTRMQSLGGEELVIPNSQLTSSRVQNFKRLQRRRVLFGFGVEYGTSVERLRKIGETIGDIIRAIEGVEFDRAHFKHFSDSSLDFEVVYYVLSSEYNVYMDLQQQINLAIVEALEKLGVAMAFPTRTVHLVKEATE